MAKRKKANAGDDWVELVALLPWWVGVLLALVSYFVLQSIASQTVAAPAQPGQIGTMVTQSIWKSFATVGQYLVPFICLLGAGTSAWRRRERNNLVKDVAGSAAADVLDGMSWREFEMLVGESFRLQGYQVVETGGGGADGGVDLVLTKPVKNGSEKFLVQCKQWRAYKVGVDVVRELYGVMAAKGATGGFVVTSGRFTDEAINFASGRNVTLVNGQKLHGLLRQARRVEGHPAAETPAAPVTLPRVPSTNPVACPRCAKPMIRRTAKSGINIGNDFWGCTGYPTCRGTRPIN